MVLNCFDMPHPYFSIRQRLSPEVEAAMGKVDRRKFVPANLRAQANADYPLPIGHGQTISQPSLVAMMTEELMLQAGARVLEIGTGCGYQTALLAELAATVHTIEIIPELQAEARQRLQALGYSNIHYHLGDGHLGWPEAAPYDAIIATSAAETLPEALVAQLATGGRMLIPIGPANESQELRRIEKRHEGVESRKLIDVRFVPMTQ